MHLDDTAWHAPWKLSNCEQTPVPPYPPHVAPAPKPHPGSWLQHEPFTMSEQYSVLPEVALHLPLLGV